MCIRDRPSKGSSHPMDTHFRISKVNKTDSRAYGMQLAIIDTGKYKDMIACLLYTSRCV